jgi:hypothetical protein
VISKHRLLPKDRHRVAFDRAVCVTAVLSMLTACGGGSGEATGRAQAAAAANVVVTADSADVITLGNMILFKAYLSRSEKVLRGSGTNSVSFAPRLSQSGFYRVYLWWPQEADASRSVAVAVRSESTEAKLSVDQSRDGGRWNSIGVFHTQTGELELRLSTSPGLTFLADAARFEYVGPKAPALAIETESLPIAMRESAYATTLSEFGGKAPYRWGVASAELPAGLIIDPTSGVLSGNPALAGSYRFMVELRDGNGELAQKTFTLEVLDSDSEAPDESQRKLDFSERREAADGPPRGTPPDLSGLLGIVASMPEGSWTRVNLNLFSDVWSPPDLRPANYGRSPTAIIGAWSSFAWDPNRGDLIIFGGGHANYSGNDVYRWRGTTRRWQRASLPSEIKQSDVGPNSFVAIDGPDNAPISAHTYDNNIFLPLIDRFVTFGGAAFNDGSAFSRLASTGTRQFTGPYLFDPSRADGNKVGGSQGSHVQRTGPHPEVLGGNMWKNRDIYVNIPGNPTLPGTYVSGCTSYAQENGKDVVYLVGRYPPSSTSANLFKYVVSDLNNPALDTIQRVGIFWTGISDQTSCGYDPVQKILLRAGNHGSPFFYWNLSTPGTSNRDVKMVPSDPSGEFANLLAGSTFKLRLCGMDFDPRRSRWVLWCGDGRVWTIRAPATLGPTGWTIIKQVSPASVNPGGAVPNGDAGTGILGKWKYIHNLDAFLGIQDSRAGNVWVYKPVGWQSPGGTANALPTVLLTQPAGGAVFQSGVPINIAANAADSDGSVVRVEFFQGTTKIGEDTTAPFGFNWSNAPAGSWSLTAVATDNAGARTVSAAVAITVQGGLSASVLLQDDGSYDKTRDVFLCRYHPTYKHGADGLIQDQFSSYTPLLRFAIFQSEGGPVPTGATIRSAKLSLYKYTAYNMTYRVHRLLQDWSEANATWNERNPGQQWAVPGANGAGVDYLASADAQFIAGWDAGWLEFNVTAAVQAMARGQNYGWRLLPVSGSPAGLKKFHSRESATVSLRPKLEITYSTN